MDKKFYAHTRPINENGVERTEYQLLSDQDVYKRQEHDSVRSHMPGRVAK